MNSSSSPLIVIRNSASLSDGRLLPAAAMVQSSLLVSAAYDDALAILQLEFRSGIVYRYFHVPHQIYRDLLQAHSKGAYFNRYIRNVFGHARLHPVGRASGPVS